MEKQKIQNQWHAFEGCQVNRPGTVTPSLSQPSHNLTDESIVRK